TNSVLHAGLSADDTLALQVDNGGDHVRLAVHDGGPGFASPVANADPLVVGGNGLVITALLSDSWGVECDENGCTVWCDIASTDRAAQLLDCPGPPVRMNASCPH